MPEEDFLTVPEAARRLGIGEKRLRRLLTRPEYADRTQTGTTQTRTGARTATLIPSPLYADIRAALELQPVALSMETNGDNRDTNGDADNADRDSVPVVGQGQRSPENTIVRVSVSALTALYEQRLATLQRAHGQELAAKDQVIAAKDETIEALRLALEATQALRLALEATQAAKTASPGASGGSQSGDSVPSGASAPSPRPKRAWWQFGKAGG